MGDNHQVSDIIPKDSMEIHGLVAEAMIMANNYVGKRIYDGFKDAAILRRHPPPSSGQFEMLVKAAKSKGFSIDYSSNRALAQSLEAIAQATRDDPETVRLIKTMATVAMNEAGYVENSDTLSITISLFLTQKADISHQVISQWINTFIMVSRWTFIPILQ